MTWKNLLENGWIAKITIILWLVSAIFILVLIERIDWIIHHDLYNFGLQFNHEWASAYWTMVKMIYVFLAVPIILSATYFGLEIWRLFKGKHDHASIDEIARLAKLAKPQQKAKTTTQQDHMLISCPKCKRVFSKPLVMLDFSTGKSRLINVCPYCNFVLSWGETEKKP
ncbi:MAG: hypothetical protein QXD95_07705 [Nitrososphaeria archaeon]